MILPAPWFCRPGLSQIFNILQLLPPHSAMILPAPWSCRPGLSQILRPTVYIFCISIWLRSWVDQSETSISVSTNRKACLRIVVKLKCTYRTFYRGFAATRNYRGFSTNESRLGGNSKGEGSDFDQSVTASNFQDRSQIEMQNLGS